MSTLRFSTAVLCGALCTASGWAAVPQAITDYRITAQFDAAKKSINGYEVVTWRNDSTDSVGELRLHLYLNGFKNEKSTFFKESEGSSRGYGSLKDGWGYIDVTRFRLLGGADLTQAIQFIQPDDGNADDQTVIRVPLPAPVEAGGQIQFEIGFVSKLPHIFARTGYHGDFVLAGQWFPKLGVYEKAGMRLARQGGWNCHQFHAASEFYADFGTYDVTLTAPSNWIVGATGVQQKRTDDAGKHTSTYVFHQENVHDFAWTASPVFVRQERTFKADTDVNSKELAATAKRFGITPQEAGLSDVRMICLLQPEHAAQMDRHFKALAASIKYFGLWYGRYPHETITLVDPPFHAGGAGGMEYPTFITSGTSWLTSGKEDNPEEVIVHEFGHQFWQGLVASNEFEEAWMDEGFNTYSTGKVLDQVYGAGALPVPVLRIPLPSLMTTLTYTADQFNRAGYLAAPKADNLNRNAWQYQNFVSYGINSYMRTGVMMRTLENYLGSDRMSRIMRMYQQRWRYAHPAAPDFFQAVQEGAGQDMKWFFDQFVNGSNVLDYAVAEATSEPVTTAPGYFGQGAGRKKVSEEDASKTDENGDKKKTQYRTSILIRRRGEATFPVEIKIIFENGETLRQNWDGQYRWTRLEYVKPAKLKLVEIDPDQKVLLDANFSNNSYRMDADVTTPLKWTSTIMFWMQNLMQWISFVS